MMLTERAAQLPRRLASGALAAGRCTTAEFIEPVVHHSFFVQCASGTIAMEQLRNFLIQHGKYSSYFTRYLCALMSHLDDKEDVLRLGANLIEELGGTADAQAAHSRIYAEMLRDFGIVLDKHPVYPETQNLIDTMFMLCRQPGGIAGLGALCLGAEAIVPAMYALIIKGFRSCGVSADRLRFFQIHVECDDDHANTMYEMIAKQISASRSNEMTAVNAAEIAIRARLRFFDALAKALP